MEKVETGDIIVISSVDKHNPDLSGSIAQNQTVKWETIVHSKYVWPFTSKIHVRLVRDEHFGS
jgi:hypothetical protein